MSHAASLAPVAIKEFHRYISQLLIFRCDNIPSLISHARTHLELVAQRADECLLLEQARLPICPAREMVQNLSCDYVFGHRSGLDDLGALRYCMETPLRFVGCSSGHTSHPG